MSQRTRSNSTPKRAYKRSTHHKPFIQVLQEQSCQPENFAPYFDICFDHKLLFTQYGSREMYVDQEPSKLESPEADNT